MNTETAQSRKPSMRSCLRRCGNNTPEKPNAVAGAVGKVKIPLRLRDFQVQWESPAFGLFHGTAFSTALVGNRWYREP
jgi:hypothetical protein